MGGGRCRPSPQVLLADGRRPAEGSLHGPLLEQLRHELEPTAEAGPQRKGALMNMTSCNPMIEDYFSQLEAKMTDLPAVDRQQFTRELRAHVLDRLEQVVVYRQGYDPDAQRPRGPTSELPRPSR